MGTLLPSLVNGVLFLPENCIGSYFAHNYYVKILLILAGFCFVSGCAAQNDSTLIKSAGGDDIGLDTDDGKALLQEYFGHAVANMLHAHGMGFDPEKDMNRADLRALQKAQWRLYEAGHVLVPPAFVEQTIAAEFRWKVRCGTEENRTAVCEVELPVADGVWAVASFVIPVDFTYRVYWSAHEGEYVRESARYRSPDPDRAVHYPTLRSVAYQFGSSVLPVSGCGSGELAIQRKVACADRPDLCSAERVYRHLLTIDSWVRDGLLVDQGFPFGTTDWRTRNLAANLLESLREETPVIANKDLPASARRVAREYGMDPERVELTHALSMPHDEYVALTVTGGYPWRIQLPREENGSLPLSTFSFYVFDMDKGIKGVAPLSFIPTSVFLNWDSVSKPLLGTEGLPNGGMGRMLGLLCAAPSRDAPAVGSQDVDPDVER